MFVAGTGRRVVGVRRVARSHIRPKCALQLWSAVGRCLQRRLAAPALGRRGAEDAPAAKRRQWRVVAPDPRVGLLVCGMGTGETCALGVRSCASGSCPRGQVLPSGSGLGPRGQVLLLRGLALGVRSCIQAFCPRRHRSRRRSRAREKRAGSAGERCRSGRRCQEGGVGEPLDVPDHCARRNGSGASMRRLWAIYTVDFASTWPIFLPESDMIPVTIGRPGPAIPPILSPVGRMDRAGGGLHPARS